MSYDINLEAPRIQYREPTQIRQPDSFKVHQFQSKGKNTINSAESKNVISDIKIVNEFSPFGNSEMKRFDSRQSCSILESSLTNDIKMWEQICDVDKTLIQGVEKGFQEIDDQIQSLAAQFDVCFNLQQKAEQQYTSFQKLIKGSVFTKFSRSNSRRTMARVVYYCSYWDAICWKEQGQKHPRQNQMIPISQILQVHTTTQNYRKRDFTLPSWAENDCFLGIEAKKNQHLELLATDNATRNLFARMIDQLLQGKSGQGQIETNFMMTQYGMDVNNIRRILDTTKQMFSINIERLKNSFIKTTQMMISEERTKTKQIRQKSQRFKEQSKATIDEVLLERNMLRQKVDQLEDFLSLENRTNPNRELVHINEMIRDILALNGDCSIQNETSTNIRQDPFQECCSNLERLRVHLDASSHIEMQLRNELQELQENYQKTVVNAHQNQNRIQVERDDLLLMNEDLAIKLDEFQQIIQIKETQFATVLKEMKDSQLQLQALLRRKDDDSAKTKMKQSDARLFGSIISLLCYLLIPTDLCLGPETVIKNVNSTILKLSQSEEMKFFSDLVGHLETRLKLTDYKECLDSIQSYTLSLRYIGFKIKCSSPNQRTKRNSVGIKYSTRVSSGSHHGSPDDFSQTTWRQQTNI